MIGLRASLQPLEAMRESRMAEPLRGIAEQAVPHAAGREAFEFSPGLDWLGTKAAGEAPEAPVGTEVQSPAAPEDRSPSSGSGSSSHWSEAPESFAEVREVVPSSRQAEPHRGDVRSRLHVRTGMGRGPRPRRSRKMVSAGGRRRQCHCPTQPWRDVRCRRRRTQEPCNGREVATSRPPSRTILQPNTA